MIKILKELKNHSFEEGVAGIGVCGISHDDNNTPYGYIYANQGFGNMETYYSVDNFIKQYPELEDIEVAVELNKENEIIKLHSNF